MLSTIQGFLSMNKPAAFLTVLSVLGMLGVAVSDAAAQGFRRPGAGPSRQRAENEEVNERIEPSALLVGDPAPALSVTRWVKGEGFSAFEKGKVYVVEFWATWCGPCLASVPHLSELQNQYKDLGVVVVGVTSPDAKNTLETVDAMTAEKGDAMAYRIAWDGDRKTMDAYMKAARQNFIPCVFLIDRDGAIAFIGHPSKVDQPLKQIVEGTFDLASASARYKQELVDQMTEEDRARERRKTYDKFARACDAGDWGAALAAYDEGSAKSPRFALDAAAGHTMDDDGKFQILLLRLKDYERASAFGNEISDGIAAEQPFVLNRIAWAIVDPANNVEKKDLTLAKKAAERADRLLRHRNAAIIDTVARVYFLEGNVPKAIELQTTAVELSDEGMRADLSATLREYQEASRN